MEIIRGFANLPKITLSTCGKDDDVFVDRLNYKYTTLILFVSSITITVKILQSDHIQCWVIYLKNLIRTKQSYLCSLKMIKLNFQL